MTDIVELRRRVARMTLGAYCLPGPEMVALLDEIERLRALVKRYEDEQCAACRAYREIEARRALEPKP